ncbi:eukaryotic translation initiation factor 5 [Gaeumannomyces tritici R3-111a-1]|uniref:Eukaryotic translation initiation factor 5 n=1 Tax=Gaeumannomyces tritici (strain R3-111a-1) TaxID=644352 RepID=J3NKI2_GAET3|nr:eukaryotic translation initiation factor 5 [Gaeumannomyces tritici R3-111a-1]EJT81799.1 eukaryotic translation initiation factor 5 [Gaeumannomyces tritici R3-111a-1]
MAAHINVRRDVTDVFYRYKMERLQTKIEGKGNGIKTVVVNLSNVAQQLARPGSYLIKYFGFELGAQTNLDPADDRWIINGAHDANKLQDYLDGFINKFVLCKKCKNPETEVNIKDGHIILDCKACGVRSDVDIRLKLSGFILKQTPKKTKKDKAERKAARKAKQNGNAKDGDNSAEENSPDGSGKENGDKNGDKAADISDDDDALTRKIKAEAQTLPAKEADKEEEDEWAVDMSAEAVKARQQSLPDEFKQKLTIGGDEDDEDGEGGGNTVYDQLGIWIQESADEKGGVDKVDDLDIYLKAKELGIETKHRTVLVLVQTVFNENICAQITKRAGMLKQIVSSERHEKALLGGTERLIGHLSKDHAEMLDKVVKILQLYYHHDLVSEEVVTKWGTRASKKYVDLATSKKVRKAAEPFLTWLAEADEEDSDDE